jgi:hypothetical protein
MYQKTKPLHYTTILNLFFGVSSYHMLAMCVKECGNIWLSIIGSRLGTFMVLQILSKLCHSAANGLPLANCVVHSVIITLGLI